MKLHFYFLIILFGLICRCDTVNAQVTYEGQVLDKSTEAAIQNVTVVLSKAKTGTSTNQQGYFSFYTPQPVADDVLMFTCIGYKTYSLPVSNYKRGMFITLQPNSNELNEVVVRNRKKTQKLAEFTKDDLDNLSEWAGPYPFFGAAMFAKPFETSKKDAVLSSIDFGRCQPKVTSPQPLTPKTTMFKVHIMTASPTTGAPDSILATQEVYSRDRAVKISVKFDSTNVMLPAKKFFVAIEWLPLAFNEYVYSFGAIGGATIDGKFKLWSNGGYEQALYQPLPAKYRRATNTRSWKLFNGVWQEFKHPQYEIALSAIINY